MTGLTTDSIPFLEYGKAPFIERKEAEAVREMVASLATGRLDATRAVDLKGESGVGKTWLLRHLAELEIRNNGAPRDLGNSLGNPALGGTANVHSLFLNLQDWNWGPEDAIREDAIRAVIIAMDQQIAGWAGQEPTIQTDVDNRSLLSDLSRWLQADVRSLLRGETRTLVLLLDHAHESPWSLLELFDHHVLGPLAVHPKIFVVTAGRGKPHPWLAPDLRMPKTISIEPFNLEQTRHQLKTQLGSKFSEVDVPAIHKLSGGYPRSNYAIGLSGLDKQREAIDSELEHLLKVVPDEGPRKELRECLEALCLLDGFHEEQIWLMLAGYHQEPAYARRSLADARALLKELRDYAFVRWDDDASPNIWRIDGRLSALLQGWVNDDEKLSIRMHCTAFALFDSWAKRYERTRERWEAKAKHHRDVLEAIGAKLADCPEQAFLHGLQ